MDIASIIILLFLLGFCIAGYRRGLITIVLRTCKRIATVVVSYFLAKPVGEMIFEMGPGEYLTSNILDKINGSVSASNNILTNENAAEVVGTALTEMKIPSFLQNIIQKIVSININEFSGQTLGYYVANALATLACTVLAFFLLMIFVHIIFFVLRKVFINVNHIPVVGFVNRVSGCALNLLFAWLLISVGFWLMSFISTFLPEVNEFCNKYIIGGSDEMTIARWFYEHNLATLIYFKLIK